MKFSVKQWRWVQASVEMGLYGSEWSGFGGAVPSRGDGSQWSSFRGAVPPIQRTRGVAGHHVSLLCTVRRGLAAFLALCIKHFGQPLAPPVVGQPSEGEHVREAVIVSDSQIVGQLPAYTVDQRLK